MGCALYRVEADAATAVYQMGEVTARSRMVRGTLGSQQASMPAGGPSVQSTPARRHSQAVHRQLGCSSTRA
jgi:hypothetical protein